MGCLSETTLAKELWGTALEAIGTTEIDPACENFLRGWIAIGIQRMVRQDRISATDLTLAQVNLKRLVELIKIEASYLSTSVVSTRVLSKQRRKGFGCVQQ